MKVQNKKLLEEETQPWRCPAQISLQEKPEAVGRKANRQAQARASLAPPQQSSHAMLPLGWSQPRAKQGAVLEPSCLGNSHYYLRLSRNCAWSEGLPVQSFPPTLLSQVSDLQTCIWTEGSPASSCSPPPTLCSRGISPSEVFACLNLWWHLLLRGPQLT